MRNPSAPKELRSADASAFYLSEAARPWVTEHMDSVLVLAALAVDSIVDAAKQARNGATAQLKAEGRAGQLAALRVLGTLLDRVPSAPDALASRAAADEEGQ